SRGHPGHSPPQSTASSPSLSAPSLQWSGNGINVSPASSSGADEALPAPDPDGAGVVSLGSGGLAGFTAVLSSRPLSCANSLLGMQAASAMAALTPNARTAHGQTAIPRARN